MPVYLENCPDYYQKKFTRETFGYVLEKLSQPGQQLCVREGGLDTITTIYALWEQFIGMLGFENGTDSHKIEAEWLKFLHYGMVKGYLQDPELLQTAAKVRNLYFRKLPQAGTNLEIFREALASYCTQNRAHLEPSYWNKFFAETINMTLTKKHVFGSTYLALAEQVRSEERIKHLGKAASRHFAINDPDYNSRLEQCFNRVKQLYSWRPSIETARLRLAKRAYARHKPQDALNHLTEAKKTIQLPPFYAYMEFCCFATLEKWNEADTFLQNPPSLPVNKPEMRSDYAAALVKLGDSRLTHNKSKAVRFVSWFTSKPRKTNSSKALIYYKQAFEIAEGAARKAILEKMCVESSLRPLSKVLTLS